MAACQIALRARGRPTLHYRSVPALSPDHCRCPLRALDELKPRRHAAMVGGAEYSKQGFVQTYAGPAYDDAMRLLQSAMSERPAESCIRCPIHLAQLLVKLPVSQVNMHPAATEFGDDDDRTWHPRQAMVEMVEAAVRANVEADEEGERIPSNTWTTAAAVGVLPSSASRPSTTNGTSPTSCLHWADRKLLHGHIDEPRMRPRAAGIRNTRWPHSSSSPPPPSPPRNRHHETTSPQNHHLTQSLPPPLRFAQWGFATSDTDALPTTTTTPRAGDPSLSSTVSAHATTSWGGGGSRLAPQPSLHNPAAQPCLLPTRPHTSADPAMRPHLITPSTPAPHTPHFSRRLWTPAQKARQAAYAYHVPPAAPAEPPVGRLRASMRRHARHAGVRPAITATAGLQVQRPQLYSRGIGFRDLKTLSFDEVKALSTLCPTVRASVLWLLRCCLQPKTGYIAPFSAS